MSQAPIWTGVSVFMQSAIAGAKTVTGITKANPGVAAATANGYSNGDYVLLLAQGMKEVNNRMFRVSGAATDSFSLEGEDTTGYSTFSSGSAQKVTFGNTFSNFASVSVSGGEPDKIDATTIHDTIKKIRYGMFSAIEFAIQAQWNLSDAGFQAAIAASKLKAERAFMFVFESGERMVFNGTVSASGVPTGSTGQIAVSPIGISVNGVPTYYSS
ncbi:phage tail tube protein [Methylomonas sp. CM2]|uniref:phage tail tube protein n=1 Tax=Methylomonas sp. CM2 TaxID=3417647 RepID=UPI003CF9C79D